MSWQKGILEFWGRKHCVEDDGKFLVCMKVRKQKGLVSGRALLLILIPCVILQLKVFIGQSVTVGYCNALYIQVINYTYLLLLN